MKGESGRVVKPLVLTAAGEDEDRRVVTALELAAAGGGQGGRGSAGSQIGSGKRAERFRRKRKSPAEAGRKGFLGMP